MKKIELCSSTLTVYTAQSNEVTPPGACLRIVGRKICLRFTYADAIARHAVDRAVSRVPMFTHEAIHGGIAEVDKLPLTVSYRDDQRDMKELYPMSTCMAMRI